MTLTLYYDPLSSPSRAVLNLLELAKIPYEKKYVSVFKGEAKSPEYLKINPLGLVPALDDNGFIVVEHEAILRYLVNTHKEAQAFLPDDAKIQALVGQYYPFHHYSVRPFTILYAEGILSLLPEGTLFDKEASLKDVESSLSKFDSIFLQDKRFLAGDNFTIADLSAVNELFQLYFATPDVDFNKLPRVKAWIERLFEDPVIKETIQPFLEFVGKA